MILRERISAKARPRGDDAGPARARERGDGSGLAPIAGSLPAKRAQDRIRVQLKQPQAEVVLPGYGDAQVLAHYRDGGVADAGRPGGKSRAPLGRQLHPGR